MYVSSLIAYHLIITVPNLIGELSSVNLQNFRFKPKAKPTTNDLRLGADYIRINFKIWHNV